LDTFLPFAFRKNLEQIEAEITRGPWRIAAYLDLVSEDRFLLFQLRSDRLTRYHPSVATFRSETAATLAPDHCLRAIEVVQENDQMDVLTPYVHPVDPADLDDDETSGLLRTLVETLAVFESHRFDAAGVGLDSLRRNGAGAFVLTPNAFILPVAMDEADAGGTTDRTPAVGRGKVPRHLTRLGVMMRLLVRTDDDGTTDERDAGEGNRTVLSTPGRLTPFRQRLATASTAILSGSIQNMWDLHELLFDVPLNPGVFPRVADAAKPTGGDGRDSFDPRAVLSALGEGSIVEISGGPASGKSGALEMIAAAFEASSGREATRIDEWDLAALSRKRAATREQDGGEVLWMVDDIDDKSFLYARPFRPILAPDGATTGGSSLVYTVNRSTASPDILDYLNTVRHRAGDRFTAVDVAAQTGDVETVETGPVGRLRLWLRAVDPGNEVGWEQTTGAGALATKLLAALHPQERQIIELVAVSRFPLPHEIVLSVFAETNGELHKRIHRLAALDLLRIDYRPLPPTGQVSITLAIQSTSLRRLVYDVITRERRENLHRTVARMAEDRGGMPTFFVFEHLVEGRERRAAAKYGVTFLKETPREKRLPYLDKLISEFFDRGLHEELTLANRLFVMYELSADLSAAGRTADAEALLLEAKAAVDEADSESLRKNASMVSDIFGLLADTWAARGHYSRALSLLAKTKDTLNPYLALPAQASLLNDIGWLQYRLGDYDRAVESCKLSLNSLNANEHPLIVAQALNIMGVINFNTSRYDDAISYYDQSAFLREREGDVNALSASYNNLALAYQTKGEYDKALGYYNKSLEIKKLQNNRVGIAAGCLNLALLYLELHNFEEAERNCRDSLEISAELGNTRLTAENYSTLGDIAYTRGHYGEAEKCYHKSRDIAHNLETINEEMGAHRRLAKLYLTTERFDAARAAVTEAAKLGRQIGSRYENAQIETILGHLDREEGRAAEAIQHYESAASSYATVSKYLLAAPLIARIGLIHFEKGNVFEAKQYLDRALDLAKSEIGHEIPDEIVTLQQMLRERPIRGGVGGTDSQKLLYAFYELSSLADYADDRVAFYKRVISVFQDLTGSSHCFMTIHSDDGQHALINRSGEQEQLADTGLRTLCNRALQLGTLLDSSSEEVGDLRDQIPVPAGSAFVCVPMRAMGKNLGCLVVHVPDNNVPLSKEDTNFFTSLGRHIAGDVRLMLHLEEHAHKEETLEKQFESLRAQVVEQYRFENLIGKDESMKQIFRTLDKVKDMDTGLLIIGESGTGKTELARTIHYSSPRRKHPFQHLHCAEIPLTLLESELFGHEKGAFTGAVQRKIGRCEAADGGTVFLDDVNVIPPEIQTKLLHYLDSKSFLRLGGTQKITTDVRIIAASNEDLESLVKAGKFREDLYYRLRVILIELPPLRERKEDTIAIAQAFLKKRCQAQGKVLKTLSSETIKLFQKYPWPGNVRELQNVLEQVVLLSDDDIIQPSSLPEDFLKKATGSSRRYLQSLEALAQQMVESGGYSEANPLMPQIEALLAEKMAGHIGSKSKAAGLLGITKPTLYTRLRGYDRMQ
jgi:Nif-specific regulatory protein